MIPILYMTRFWLGL